MTKHILIVLDSCRFDSYQRANTKDVGVVHPYHTDSNHTITAFIDFLCVNKLPHPIDSPNNPWFKKTFNFVDKIRCPVYFLSDNPHLHPVNLHVKGLIELGVFKEYKIFEPNYRSCVKIIKHANDLNLQDNYFIVLWFGETHQPFDFGNDTNDKWKDFSSRVDKYNNGEDVISDSEMEYMHERQISACEFIMQQLWKRFLKDHLDATIIITSDHGESFGENHKFGHGCDIHEAQFLVPFITNLEG